MKTTQIEREQLNFANTHRYTQEGRIIRSLLEDTDLLVRLAVAAKDQHYHAELGRVHKSCDVCDLLDELGEIK